MVKYVQNCRADLRRIIGDEEKIPDFIPRVRNEVLPEVRCMTVKEQFQMSLKTTMIECKFPVWNFEI